MLSDIITENGLDLGIATTGNDSIIMSQLPPEQIAYFSASPFPDAIALLQGDDNLLNDNTGRIFYGNQGSDTILGGGGNDTLFGGQDDDFLEAGGGNSILFGNFGNDTLIGGPGNDSLYGGAGNDVVIGGSGNSIVSGDKGLDTLTGSGSANQFILASSGADQDVITDFQPGIDKMRLPAGVTFADLEVRGSGANTEILRNGEVVAILNGVISSSINSNDFITAGQETPPAPPQPPEPPQPPAPLPPPVSVEPGNTPETAGDLGLFSGIREFDNFVGTADLDDYYRFTLSEVHEFDLDLFGMSQNANVELYLGEENLDGTFELGQRIYRSDVYGNEEDWIEVSLGAGTYFVRVYPYSGWSGTADTRYTLRLAATPTGITDIADNTFDLGILDGTSTFTDFVGNADEVDYYRFTLDRVKDVNLILGDLEQNADIELYLAGEQQRDGSWNVGERITSSSQFGNQDDSISRTLGAGTYHVRVYPYSGWSGTADTRYTLQMTATA